MAAAAAPLSGGGRWGGKRASAGPRPSRALRPPSRGAAILRADNWRRWAPPLPPLVPPLSPPLRPGLPSPGAGGPEPAGEILVPKNDKNCFTKWLHCARGHYLQLPALLNSSLHFILLFF